MFATVAHIKGILGDPGVSAAIHNLEPFSPSLNVVPEASEEPEHAGAMDAAKEAAASLAGKTRQVADTARPFE